MLDAQLKPWLIEVNHAPSFSTESPLDYSVKYDLILDTLSLLDLKHITRISYKQAMFKRSITGMNFR
jgi:tubulin polyglutamylase TTLL6/13